MIRFLSTSYLSAGNHLVTVEAVEQGDISLKSATSQSYILTLSGGGTSNSCCSMVAPAPSISFRADQINIQKGRCTNLRWDVENARAIYVDNTPTINHSSLQICPTSTTVYTLVHRGGNKHRVFDAENMSGCYRKPVEDFRKRVLRSGQA